MSAAPEIKTVNLGEFLADRMITKLEAQPITVEYRLSDGTITEEITEKHPWFKELNRQRTEQISALRAKLSPTPNPQTQKETAASRQTKTAESVNQNESNSRTAN